MVNDRSAGSERFQVNPNDRSIRSNPYGLDGNSAVNQFAIQPGSNASSQFMVNDRSVASEAFALSGGRSIGQHDF